MKLKRILASFGASLFIAASMPLAATAATTTTVVTPSDMQGWVFYNDETDTIDSSLGSFVTGPETPPAGTGSVQISVSGTQRRNLATYQFADTVLADITELKYSTYNPSAGNGGSANRSGYLQFNVDFDGSDTWQRRLTYLPVDNGTILQDEWQEWDAASPTALWRYSGATWPVTGGSGATPKTWAQIQSDYPGVSIRATDAFLGVRVGEPYANGYTENIDRIVFGTVGDSTVFDFEPALSPADKADCKDGGWMSFNAPAFRNQGDCVSYVASQGRSGGNPVQAMLNFLTNLF